MNLAIDIGNTRTKIGLFENKQMKKVLTFEKEEKLPLEKIFLENDIKKTIISSTIQIPQYILKIVETRKNHLILDSSTKLPFINQYSSKDTLGKDRLALIAAAQSKFPNQDTLVIGCGTCITFNFITKNNAFLGGSIHPGLKMRLMALHTFTGKLPLVDLEKKVSLIGNDTKSNILTGVLFATGKEIEGMLDEYLVKFPQMNRIITGGDAELLVSTLKNEIFAISDFTLIGLNHILEYNA